MSACATNELPKLRPIKFYAFDIHHNRIVNAQSDSVYFDSDEIHNYACLNREDFKLLYLSLGGKYAETLDDDSTLD
ncbi:MAG: hypothetical protein KJO73_09130 [Croceitalea sp.]|nr:hypothetical protein [Croceitalea sp.]